MTDVEFSTAQWQEAQTYLHERYGADFPVSVQFKHYFNGAVYRIEPSTRKVGEMMVEDALPLLKDGYVKWIVIKDAAYPDVILSL